MSHVMHSMLIPAPGGSSRPEFMAGYVHSLVGHVGALFSTGRNLLPKDFQWLFCLNTYRDSAHVFSIIVHRPDMPKSIPGALSLVPIVQLHTVLTYLLRATLLPLSSSLDTDYGANNIRGTCHA